MTDSLNASTDSLNAANDKAQVTWEGTPAWLDRTLYPFEPHSFGTEHGQIHYVDEGTGPLVLLVHGTPTWSFLWRELIGRLAQTHRVVAPDHLGFGLSDKPPGAPYRPEDHAARLAALIDHLELCDITLVVHDFGGPIGLSYALERPQNVRAFVLYNTWFWSRADDTASVWASRLLGGPIGRFFYTRLNLSPRVLLPALFSDRAKLSPTIHRHYLRPFPDARSRHAPAALAEELIRSSAWFDKLWSERAALTAKPALLVWGEKDSAFGEDDLQRLQGALPNAQTLTYPDAGHFVQEEVPDSAGRVASFIQKLSDKTNLATKTVSRSRAYRAQ